jgi:hypothetical protein
MTYIPVKNIGGNKNEQKKEISFFDMAFVFCIAGRGALTVRASGESQASG